MSPPPSDPERRPLLALSAVVVFPGDVTTVDVRGERNLRTLEGLIDPDPLCVALPLEDLEQTAPRNEPGMAWTGTLVRVLSRVRLPGGEERVVLQGLRRAGIEAIAEADGVMTAVDHSPPAVVTEASVNGTLERLLVPLRTISAVDPGWPAELAEMIPLYGDDHDRITDLASSVLPLSFAQRAHLLAERDPGRRLGFLADVVEAELNRRPPAPVPTVAPTLPARTNPSSVVRAHLERAIDSARLPENARRAALRELQELDRSLPNSAQATRIRSYLEWILQLPWSRTGVEKANDLRRFERVVGNLEKSHVGLTEVKQRIAEFLAVRKLGGGARGTVLCFVGPPGTGKSSMGRAVAAALGRSYLTIAVGAMTREREIAGVSHRQEAGMPGAILAGLHRCGKANPVVLLDEIDKLSLGGEGTASGTLLELLDPERNAEFLDHYLSVPFDLSRCLFLATANDADAIPEALLDRMETIEFNGYTESEKYRIARSHLLPRARGHAGLRGSQLSVSPASLKALIRNYTEEAGVRHLQRLLISLARKAAVEVVHSGEGLSVKKTDLVRLIGPRTVDEELRLRRPAIGVATGLAWTSVGGALLPIEAVAMQGSGRMILTGQVGEVLRESVQTAASYIRTCMSPLGLEPSLLDSLDLHLHFPSAATPKDGPSAGIAIATALVSLLTGRPSRHDVAMTGELSLLGTVLPVGGIREKLLAATRAGIPSVVVPARNGEDVLRLPVEIRGPLTIHPVAHVQDVIDLALLGRPRRGRSEPRSTARRRRSARGRGSRGLES